MPGFISRPGLFDFDDAGAQIPEYHRAEGSRYGPSQIQYLQALQGRASAISVQHAPRYPMAAVPDQSIIKSYFFDNVLLN